MLNSALSLSVCLCEKELRQRYRDSDDRPDIAVFECGIACNCDLDITMAHPWSSDVFLQSGMKEGVAAKRREERKEAKYSKLYSSTGEKSSVMPLVFEHFGRWGEKAETYLSSLASRSRDEAGRKIVSDFKCY